MMELYFLWVQNIHGFKPCPLLIDSIRQMSYFKANFTEQRAKFQRDLVVIQRPHNASHKQCKNKVPI